MSGTDLCNVTPLQDNRAAAPLLLKALRREPCERPPVWLMRQAGRYLPEYRALRERFSFLDICRSPELALEAALQPMRAFCPDAAIVFADILLPLEAMGLELSFDPAPQIANPITSSDEARTLRIDGISVRLRYVFESVALLKRALADFPEKALIGFSGAPWTTACYMLKCRHRNERHAARIALAESPDVVSILLEKLQMVLADYIIGQVEAGADVIQLFDTWAGMLSPDDYRRFALPATQQLVEVAHRSGVPVILYVNGGSHLLEAMAESEADSLSIDWRTSLVEARERTGSRVVLQGNYDPARLFAAQEIVEREARLMIDRWPDKCGYVVNLGHGVLPGTPCSSVSAFVSAAKQGWREKR